MSEFVKFYQAAVKLAQAACPTPKKAPPVGGQKKVRCKYCFSVAEVHEPGGRVHCRTCGSSFAVIVGKPLIADQASLEMLSPQQLYDVAFLDGEINLSLLERAAEQKELKALLFLGRYWEKRGERGKAEAYYETASQVSHEGMAAYVLYRFRQEPPFSQYPQLLEELKTSLGEYVVHDFYTIDPNVCDEVLAEREARYQAHLDDEAAERERAMQAAEVPESYGFSSTVYAEPPPADDGADWNGMPWQIPGIGAGV